MGSLRLVALYKLLHLDTSLVFSCNCTNWIQVGPVRVADIASCKDGVQNLARQDHAVEEGRKRPAVNLKCDNGLDECKRDGHVNNTLMYLGICGF